MRPTGCAAIRRCDGWVGGRAITGFRLTQQTSHHPVIRGARPYGSNYRFLEQREPKSQFLCFRKERNVIRVVLNVFTQYGNA
jgi:hypothetical protein